MGTEIERKFLVKGSNWTPAAAGERCVQGYLSFGPPVAIRVRIMGGIATLNIKTATATIARHEFEYEIPVDDAHAILSTSCMGAAIEKTRYTVDYEGKTWEIDVFDGANAGLIVAEIELESEEEPFARPPWVGLEVSGDPRYLNALLCQHPYSTWQKENE
ncbi:MAG TPA: CYTH domain-containing protein [Candidatus Hydrogenedentes bacterium]|nr:CYTH domain-containing protein [Candidatus Hydrogenedentota bacterium]